jgi:hypothetical protein
MKYRLKPPVIEAILYNEGGFAEMPTWLSEYLSSGKGQTYRRGFQINTTNKINDRQSGSIGDYLCYNKIASEVTIFILNEEELRDAYDKL